MECAYAERLRNIALVSISRELRTLTKRRDSGTKVTDLSLRKGQDVILLRKKTDEDRKALRDHLSNCRRCRNTDRHIDSDSTAEQKQQPHGS
jgi:hypothetical protein